MLIDFRVKNFRSFKDWATFSMVADEKVELPQNTFEAGGLTLLKTAAIYGANASGKSNLIRAMQRFFRLILDSYNTNRVKQPIPEYDPFLLGAETKTQPIEFEVRLLMGGVIYRYGVAFNRKEIVEEWLFEKKKKEIQLFMRTQNRIELSKKFGKEVAVPANGIGPEFLLLSFSALNEGISRSIVEEVRKNTIILDDFDIRFHGFITSDFVHRSGAARKDACRLLTSADLNIKSIQIIDRSLPESLVQEFKNNVPDSEQAAVLETVKRQESIHCMHPVFDIEGREAGEIPFPLAQESEGTKRLFAFTEPIYATLESGGALVVDELDASLHPLLQEHLVKLFQDPQTNPKNAQLIFTTHSTEILNNRLFRRDQVWFAEKDDLGATELFSLLEIKGVRKDLSYGKNYLLGTFGAVPKLKSLKTTGHDKVK